MTTKDFIVSLEILQPFGHDHGYDLSAEHDAIYYSCKKRPTDEAALELLKLGWSNEQLEGETVEERLESYRSLDDWATKCWYAFV